jgi:MFS family permease
VVRDRVFRRIWLIVLVLVVAGYAQYHAAFPLFATGVGGLSPSGLSLAFAANTITVVVAQLLVLRMMIGRRRTRGVVLSVALVATAWITTLLAAAGDPDSTGLVLFVTAMVLFGAGETLLSPTVPAIVNDLAPERLRGRYNGAYTLAWTGGYIVGPALAGFAIAAGHGHALFVAMIGVLAAAAFGALRLERYLPPEINHIAAVDSAPAAGSPDAPPPAPVAGDGPAQA